MKLMVHKGRIRFCPPVFQKENIREFVVQTTTVFVTIFALLVLATASFSGGVPVMTWASWFLVFSPMLACSLLLVLFVCFFPLKSEKAERMMTSCLNSEDLAQIEIVFKEAVSSRLSELARTVVYLQNNDPTCDHSKKQEFRQLFDAAKTLNLIGPSVDYGHFFRPATEFVKSDLP